VEKIWNGGGGECGECGECGDEAEDGEGRVFGEMDGSSEERTHMDGRERRGVSENADSL
jgi:hypothetical protein